MFPLFNPRKSPSPNLAAVRTGRNPGCLSETIRSPLGSQLFGHLQDTLETRIPRNVDVVELPKVACRLSRAL
jgi:hypothetical protein